MATPMTAASRARRAEAQRLYAAGLNTSEIARQLDANPGTVWRWIHRKLRREGHKCPTCDGELRMKGGNGWACLDCGASLSRYQGYTEEQKQANREQSLRYRIAEIARRKAVVAVLKNIPCTDCDGRFPAVAMDFDHVRGVKEYDIAMMVGQARGGRAAFERELAKCEVVCANCHRVRHHA